MESVNVLKKLLWFDKNTLPLFGSIQVNYVTITKKFSQVESCSPFSSYL